MQRLIQTVIFSFLVPTFVFSQTKPVGLPAPKVLFENFHGLRNDTQHNYMEGEGYNIAIVTFQLSPSEANFKKAAKKTFPKYSIVKQKMNDDPFENFVIEKIDSKNDITVIKRAFIIKGDSNNIKVISFARCTNMDTIFVNNVVASVVFDGVYDSVFTSVHPSSLNFLDHDIRLGNTCHWMGPHNMQCSHYGQINWSVYKTLADAEEFKQIQIELTKAKKLTKVLSEEKVPVIFEGTETIADKITYKVKLPKAMTGGSNILIAYYVATEIRGKYVHCVMSFYDNEAPKGKLAPFINEVMKLK